MGTSASSKGPGSQSPLVPPWADANPGTLLPPPEPRRFKPFRLSLSRFVQSGNKADLYKAMGHYARTATGGRNVGARRFGSASKTGGALFGLLSDLRSGGTGEAIVNIDLSSLNGKDLDYAIQEIARVVTCVDGDAEKTKVAVQHALSETLEGLGTFNSSVITDEMLVNIMILYVRDFVFQQIVMESGKALQGLTNGIQAIEVENAILELVSVIVEKTMSPFFINGISLLTRQQVEGIQQKTIAEVMMEWGKY